MELHRYVAAGASGELGARKRGRVFVEFVTHDLGAAVVSASRGHILFLHATERESKFIDARHVPRRPETYSQRLAEKIRELVVVEEAIAIAHEVRKHLDPARPKGQSEQREQARKHE